MQSDMQFDFFAGCGMESVSSVRGSTEIESDFVVTGGDADWDGICAVSAMGYGIYSRRRVSKGNHFPTAA